MNNHNERALKTYFEGKWHDGNYPILGAGDHATWLGTLVFDGARRFNGVTPDLDLHCKRIVRSAEAMGLVPAITGEEIEVIVREGLAQIPLEKDLYIRPMMWSIENGPGLIEPVPESVGFAVCLEHYQLPEKLVTMKLALSNYRRPTLETAIVNAKASSLYANSGRIIAQARKRGFHNAVVLDANGNVAETGSTNLFIVKDNIVKTPIPNGSFLAGITRARTMILLADAGYQVVETTLTVDDLHNADEMFITANFSKIVPITHFEDTEYKQIEVGSKARALYWAWAAKSDG